MKKTVFLTILLLTSTFISCTTTQTTTQQVPEIKKVEAQRANELELREFRDAEHAYKIRKNTLALKKFSSFVQRHPAIDLTNDAYFYMGQIYHDQGNQFQAARYWIAVVDSPLLSHWYDRALLGAANAQAQLGHIDDALRLLARFKTSDQTDRNIASQIFELSAKLKLQHADAVGSIEDLLKAADMKMNPADKDALISRAADIVSNNLSTKQLNEFISTGKYPNLDVVARYRLATLNFDDKDWSAAKEGFQNIVSKYPSTEQAKRSQQYLATIEAQERTDSTVVGVVLPLTGKFSQQGYKTLRGIQMGLGLFKKGPPSPLKLAIIDSEGNAETARRGVEKLVREDHVVGVIGDVSSKTAQAVAAKCQELGVPNVTLSQRQDLIDIGDFIFRGIVTANMQMHALTDIAMKKINYKRFAIIYPNDSYGTEYASDFWDYVLANGGQITAAQTYQPEETDFRDVIQRLVGTFYGEEDRGKELALRIGEWKKDPARKANEKPPRDILPPVVDFDAIFIPDSAKAVGQIAPMLAYNDVDKIPLLGTNLWNTPQIVIRGQKFVEKSLFIDDYFSDDQSPEMKKFTTDFQAQFNYKPDVFESHGYDAAVIVGQVLTSRNYDISRALLKEKLAQVSGIAGSTGPLTMSPNREIEKPLIPLTVEKGQIVRYESGSNLP